MHICYLDESGGFEAPNSRPDATPLLALAGLVVPVTRIASLTAEFLDLKRKFFPRLATERLDYMLAEVKGSDLRRSVRTGSTAEYRHALRVLRNVVGLIENHDVRVLGRIWIKATAESLDPDATYVFAMQDIARHFDHFLRSQHERGLIVCDSRGHGPDIRIAHAVFTRKHRPEGDALPNLIETSLFAKSENHAGVQLADIVASALLFPMAARVYCPEVVGDPHTSPEYDQIRLQFADRLRARQYLYRDGRRRTRGGVVVSDSLGRQPSRELFRLPAHDP